MGRVCSIQNVFVFVVLILVIIMIIIGVSRRHRIAEEAQPIAIGDARGHVGLPLDADESVARKLRRLCVDCITCLLSLDGRETKTGWQLSSRR